FYVFSSRRRHTRSKRDWSSDVCSSDLSTEPESSSSNFSSIFSCHSLCSSKNSSASSSAWTTTVGENTKLAIRKNKMFRNSNKLAFFMSIFNCPLKKELIKFD